MTTLGRNAADPSTAGPSRLGTVLLAAAFLTVACDSPRPSATTTPEPTAAAQQTDTAPSASTDPGTSPDLAAEAPAPTAADLILADMGQGLLDQDTATLYRIYAVFGDPRLPAKYTSEVVVEDEGAFEAARERIDLMPPEIAAELRPYLVRPTDPTSPFHQVARTATGGLQLASWLQPEAAVKPALGAVGPVVCNPDPLSEWGYVRGANPFKVWGSCATAASQADIQLVTAIVEELWDAEQEFLARVPIPDDGSPVPDEWVDDEGGDGSIDIYLTSPCVYRAGSCQSAGTAYGAAISSNPYRLVQGEWASSGFIVVPQTGLANASAFRSTMAHELFHIFQKAMNVGGRINPTTHRSHWFTEASAVWAEWHFVPGSARPEVSRWFPHYQASPFDLQSVDGINAYTSYTWPLFMEEQAGAQSVADAWHAIEGKHNWVEVTDAIDSQLTFDRNFRKFAVRNWNEDIGAGEPLDPLHPLQAVGTRMQPRIGRRVPDKKLLPSPPGPLVTELPVDIRSLYDTYWTFSVDPDVAQIILEFSGVTPADTYDADVLVNVKDKGWEYRKLKKGTTTWCTDNPDDDITEFVVIVSNHDMDRAARVGGQWTVQSPIEPCFSYHVHIDWTDVYNGINDHFVFDGWADIVQPDLSGNGVVTLQGSGTITGERPGWRSCNPGFPGVPSGSGPAIFVASIAGDQVSLSAFPDINSTDFGVSTQPFTMDRKGGMLTIESAGSVGDLCPRSWFGTITAELKLKEPLGNEEGT